MLIYIALKEQTEKVAMNWFAWPYPIQYLATVA